MKLTQNEKLQITTNRPNWLLLILELLPTAISLFDKIFDSSNEKLKYRQIKTLLSNYPSNEDCKYFIQEVKVITETTNKNK